MQSKIILDMVSIVGLIMNFTTYLAHCLWKCALVVCSPNTATISSDEIQKYVERKKKTTMVTITDAIKVNAVLLQYSIFYL